MPNVGPHGQPGALAGPGSPKGASVGAEGLLPLTVCATVTTSPILRSQPVLDHEPFDPRKSGATEQS
jgi:hypothetical protein